MAGEDPVGGALVFGVAPASLTVQVGQSCDLAVTLTNVSGAPIALTGGAAVPEDPHHPPAATTLYLMVGSFAPDESSAGRLRVSLPGWQATRFGTTWALTPQDEHAVLAVGGSLPITIGGVLVTALGYPTLYIDYYNGAVRSPLLVPITVQHASTDPALAIDVNLGPAGTGPSAPTPNDEVIVFTTADDGSRLPNAFRLSLTNPSQESPLVSKDWGQQSPQFVLRPMLSDTPGYTVLTTTDLADRVQFTVTCHPSGAWTCDRDDETHPADPARSSVVWLITPDKTNRQLLGPADTGGIL